MTQAIDYPLISSDDHIIEPPDVWNGRLESRYQDRAPLVVSGDEGEFWTFEGQKIPNIGLSVMAGKKVRVVESVETSHAEGPTPEAVPGQES